MTAILAAFDPRTGAGIVHAVIIAGAVSVLVSHMRTLRAEYRAGGTR